MALKDVIGQGEAIAILERAIENQRYPHAYLFTGEEGVGKRLTALNVAKALNCNSPVQFDACDQCVSCSMAEKRLHPDIIFVEPEVGKDHEQKKEITVEQLRELEERIARRAFTGGKKVVIVNGAEKMNRFAANSMLKTLEEPPPDTLIILITTSPYALLPTIVSRCQQVRFAILKGSDIYRILIKLGYEGKDAQLLSSVSCGKVGYALSMDANDFRYRMADFLKTLSIINPINSSYRAMFSKAEELSKSQQALDGFIERGMLWFRDLMIFKSTGKFELVMNLESKENISMEDASLDEIIASLRLLYNTERISALNLNRRLAVEVLFLRLLTIMEKGYGC
ncbi:MAG: DNA polymerase III subunit delta' [Nitrospirota bacterium]